MFYLKRSDGTYSDVLPNAKQAPPARSEGVWVEGSPDGLEAFVPKDPAEILTTLYGTLSLDVQEKYEDLALKGLTFLQFGNLPMVQRKYTKALEVYDDTVADEVTFITAVQQALGL